MPGTIDILKQKLATPSSTFRPVQIIHGKYPKTAEDTKEYLDIAEKNGLGGFVVNMDYEPERLENESDEAYNERRLDGYLGTGKPEYEHEWQCLKSFIQACFDRGMKVWIYDELKYPSGAAGNKVLKGHPDYQVKGLTCISADVNGGKGVIQSINADLVYAAAYPVTENGLLDAENPVNVDVKEDKIYYDLPEGNYKVCGFYTKKLAFLTENVVPYPDLMRADVIDRFIEVTYEEYRKHLGEDIISKITAFFTDEPSLPTHGCSQYFYETGAICAWTEELSRIFPNLPQICVDIFFDTKRTAPPYHKEIRHSYWQEAAKLFAKNYFGKINDWCTKYGSRLTGHMYGEETLGMQIGLNAELFGLLRKMEMPGVDRLYCTDPRDVTAEKTATSVAHMYGKPYTMSENSFHFEKTFWDMEDQVTLFNRTNSAYYQIQLGLTNISSYFPYDPLKTDKEWNAFCVRTARASEFITTGTHKADVLVLIPMESAWEHFTPQDHKYWLIGPAIVAPYQGKQLQVLEEAYGETLLRLVNDRIDYDLTDALGLTECVVENGTIRTPYESFNHLVIFNSGCFAKDVALQIEKFLSCGGTVTAVNSIAPSAQCAQWAKKYPDSFRFSDFSDVCDAVLCGNAKRVLETDAPNTVRVRRSQTSDADLWFIHNRADKCTVNVHEAGVFYKMTPDSGDKTEIINSDGTFKLDLPAGSAVMLIREK